MFIHDASTAIDIGHTFPSDKSQRNWSSDPPEQEIQRMVPPNHKFVFVLIPSHCSTNRIVMQMINWFINKRVKH